MEILSYITENALILIPVLLIIGRILKGIEKIPDKWIPLILLPLGVVGAMALGGWTVDSAVQGTVSAFLTVLIGYKTKKYLCSDYKKQEKLDAGFEDGVDVGDDEVKIASAWAKRIRVENERGRHETNA